MFAASARNGRGQMIYPDGSEYNGEWRDDRVSLIRNFFSTFVLGYFPDYNGEISYGSSTRLILKFCLQRQGIGKFNSQEGFEYEGEWKDDRKEGRGKMKYVDGSLYEGIWKDDKVRFMFSIYRQRY